MDSSRDESMDSSGDDRARSSTSAPPTAERKEYALVYALRYCSTVLVPKPSRRREVVGSQFRTCRSARIWASLAPAIDLGTCHRATSSKFNCDTGGYL
jgi:hypothetical protein